MSLQYLACPACRSVFISSAATTGDTSVRCPHCLAEAATARRGSAVPLLAGVIVLLLGLLAVAGTVVVALSFRNLSAPRVEASVEDPAFGPLFAEATLPPTPASAETQVAKDKSSPLAADAAVPALRYQWQAGKAYVYEFKLEANDPAQQRVLSGTTRYQLVSDEPADEQEVEKEEGTGTAFVISSDGYLLTCEHVIEGASSVEVFLGDQSYPATVAARDAEHDVAVLHIEAHGLSPLVLGDSHTVQLAEEVRAIGFPLSDILGTSLKVTRGTVSGLAEMEGRRFLQVDASVNPGNSGGPIVNNRGQVIAIASNLLAESGLSAVSLGVPIDEAKQLLESHDIGFRTSGGNAELNGPALVRQVAPSVAFVKVAIPVGPMTGERRLTLAMTTNFSDASIPATESQIVVDEYGQREPLEDGPRMPFPLSLGPVGPFGGEVFSAQGERTWARMEMAVITQGGTEAVAAAGSKHAWQGHATEPGAEPGTQDFYPVPYRPSPGFRGYQPRRQSELFEAGRPHVPQSRFGVQRVSISDPADEDQDLGAGLAPAWESVEYCITAASAETVEVHKQYRLQSLEADIGGSGSELAGEGRMTFDLQAGVPTQMQFQGTFTLADGQGGKTVPLTMSYRLIAVEDSAPAATALPASKPANPKDAGTAGNTEE